MQTKIKESLSRILLIVFFAMVLISATFPAAAGTLVVLYAFMGLLPIITVLLGIPKHRIYISIGMLLILILMAVHHTASQKRYENNMTASFKEIEELKQQLAEHQNKTQ